MNDERQQIALLHRLSSAILLLGIILRIAVFLTASPFNPDQHLEVIDYIVANHRLPASLELGQAHHPPLYHLLMAPIWAATGSAKMLQFVSLIFSIANLLITAKLLVMLVEPKLARNVALAFAAFLPQLVMYGSFVSNDSLTILLGTVLFLRGVVYSKEPTTRNAIWLGVVCGLGLLTKGTFLLAPVAILLLPLPLVLKGEGVGVRGRRVERERPEDSHGAPLTPALSPDYGGVGAKRGAHLIVILSIALLLGGYKYAENLANYGRPFVHNLDPDSDWKRDQQGKWPSAWARWNPDLLHILREPILKVNHPASYPMLLYATLWYPHWPDSSYTAGVNGYAWVGQVLYVAGVAPTLILVVGMFYGRRSGAEASGLEIRGIHRFAVSLLLFNIALVVAVGAKFDAWSCFQARLCFASFAPGVVLFAWGLDALRWKRAIMPFLIPAIAGCLMYFVVEIAFALEWLPRGTPLTP